MLWLIRSWNKYIGYSIKYRSLLHKFRPYFENVKSVLDIGAGSGRFTNELSKHFPHIEFTGVDVHVPQKIHIPIKKYDGKKLPFKDDSFDCVIMIDVLHHSTHPEEILKEAKRVSRRCILIKDHYWNNRLDFLLLKLADYIGNKPYNINLPYNFFKTSDWKNIANETGLKITKSDKFRYSRLDPCKQISIIMEK